MLFPIYIHFPNIQSDDCLIICKRNRCRMLGYALRMMIETWNLLEKSCVFNLFSRKHKALLRTDEGRSLGDPVVVSGRGQGSTSGLRSTTHRSEWLMANILKAVDGIIMYAFFEVQSPMRITILAFDEVDEGAQLCWASLLFPTMISLPSLCSLFISFWYGYSF